MKPFWIVILTAIIAGGLAGGGTWYYFKKQSDSDKKALQSQIDALNASITALQKSASSTSTAATAAATANWKTYTNTKYGYSFKYPTGWVLEEPNISTKYVDPTSDDIIAYNPNEKGSIGLTSSNSETRSLDQLVSAVMGKEDQSTYSVSDANINGFTAKKIVITQKSGMYDFDGTGSSVLENEENIYLLKFGNKIEQIVFQGKDWKENQSMLEQILSTFQFTQ